MCVLGVFGTESIFRVISKCNRQDIVHKVSVTQTMTYLSSGSHSLVNCVLCYRARMNKLINSGLCMQGLLQRLLQ